MCDLGLIIYISMAKAQIYQSIKAIKHSKEACHNEVTNWHCNQFVK